ncbi:hypothetical protein Klosneuvirus_5_61 [Klosneuvirus KNV1]|uniref:Uncharacterized protein n=1 Tax=Klosneuvirus KNV1 TaxID=1977640 RepID=A0A1V0SL51_9VIRU|nr:hypothetical protein Klosneuvirus_5_61 [Klosneuvirus KNV1]
MKQYYIKTKDISSEKKKQYYNNNKDIIAEKRKQYHANNRDRILLKATERCTCECGSDIIKANITHHRKTKKHITLMNQIS